MVRAPKRISARWSLPAWVDARLWQSADKDGKASAIPTLPDGACHDGAQKQGRPVNQTSFDAMRTAMVRSQLRTTGVNDPTVIDAMAAVPRERFVDPAARAAAYADIAPPTGAGRHLLPPMILGNLLTRAELDANDRALVVGAATGYAAAVLAAMGLKVVALEADAGLAGRAREIAPSGVEVVEGELEQGWPTGAPYDLILLDGAIEEVPSSLIAQLKDGGRIAAVIVGEDGVPRSAVAVRAGEGFGWDDIGDAPAAAALPGFRRPRGFRF